MALILILFLRSVVIVASEGSHSLRMFATYSTGKMPFPEYCATVMLDDITVGYFDSNTRIYIPRGNTKDESDVINPDNVSNINGFLLDSFKRRSILDENGNYSEGLMVYQTFAQCELLDNGEPGLMITRDAARGSTTDVVHLHGDNFTFQSTSYISAQDLKVYLKRSEEQHRNLYYPTCISVLKNYLSTRASQLNRKIQPTVRMIQKPHSVSGGSRVSCLATGFYPRHINLTLFRVCKPVLDHEITGGDLLPNNDGTYQMRKSLEISAEEEREKHNYTCSVTHISLDNKRDVTLDNRLQSQQSVVIAVTVGVLVLMLLCVTVVIMRRRQARRPTPTDSSKNDYNSVSLNQETKDFNADEWTT